MQLLAAELTGRMRFHPMSADGKLPLTTRGIALPPSRQRQNGGFMQRLSSAPLRFKDRRRETMLEPDEVSAILRLNELGWGSKWIARELGISRNSVKDYVGAGGWTPYRQPQRKKALAGQETWLKERLRQHHGNADVIRQELAAESSSACAQSNVRCSAIARSLRRKRATVRFETSPGKQLQAILANGWSRSAAARFAPTCSSPRWATRAGTMSQHSARNGKRVGSMAWKAPS